MNWIETTIGEYCPFIYGKSLPKTIRKSGKVPVYGSNGCVDFHNESCVNGAGIIIGRKGSVGEVHLSKVPFWPIDTSFYLQKDSLDELQFTYFLLKSLGLENMNSDSAVPGLNRENAHALKIQIPELKEDREFIGNWISVFDKKIELNRQTNQTLEQIAQAMFKSWFVDFEPTRAKIAAKAAGSTAQEIEQAAMRAISGKTQQALNQLPQTTQQTLKATAKLFPEAMEESELGEIPQGWVVKSLSEIINIIGGGTPKRSEESYWNGDIPWFSVRDVPASSDIFVVDTDEKISQLGLQKSSTKLLPVGTTIISARGTVGKLALVATPMCMNQSCYGIQGIDGFGTYFTYFNLREAVDTLLQNVHGAVFDTITTQTFESYSMAICNGEITKQFDVMVEPLLKKIELNVRENNTLSKLRDSLLPKLLSGEIQAH